jgi:hypothetical protein
MFLIQLLFQPLFPGESGVDQLVEIIKVRLILLFFQLTYPNFFFIIFPTVSVNILYTMHVLEF